MADEKKYRIAYVRFGKSPRGVPYLCEIENVNKGDSVLVDGIVSPKEVLEIEEYTESTLPISIDKLKKVIKKFEPESATPVSTVSVSSILKACDFLTLIEAPQNEVYGRDREIQMLVESMYKKRMKNTILVGPAGSGKTAIIEAFAEKVKDDYIVMELNQGSMIAGTTYRGDYEKKITDALNYIIDFNSNNEKKIILFIDEIHTIVASGATDSFSAGDIIKTYLSKMQIMVIGATTNKEFDKYLAHDAALCRRLSPIYINELSDDIVINILDNFAEHEVEKEILEYILEQAKTLPMVSIPDTPIEVLDRCLAKHYCYKVDVDLKMVDEVVDDMNSIKGGY